MRKKGSTGKFTTAGLSLTEILRLPEQVSRLVQMSWGDRFEFVPDRRWYYRKWITRNFIPLQVVYFLKSGKCQIGIILRKKLLNKESHHSNFLIRFKTSHRLNGRVHTLRRVLWEWNQIIRREWDSGTLILISARLFATDSVNDSTEVIFEDKSSTVFIS